MKKHLLTCFCSVLLTACAVGPDYVRPQTAADAGTTFLNAPEQQAEVSSMSRWWERIDDPLLPEYVNKLVAQNLQLKEAGARILQSRAGLRSQRGGFFPTLSANNAATRSFSPAGALNIPGAAGNSGRFFNTNYTSELQASWQLDLFGRVRRSVEAADAQFQASLYDQEALTHSLIAELMTRRIAIALYQRLITLAQDNADNRETIYKLVQTRYDLGAQNTTLEDLLLAKENYTTVAADVSEYRRLLKDEAYAFDVLLGQKPGTTDVLASSFPILPAPMDTPVCLPGSLLDRRPNLKASELRLKAANADIGVAVADLYPSLGVNGALGFSGISPNDLWTYDQLAASIAGTLTARLFEGGALRANIDLQKAEAEELAHAYAGQVLEAIREVESALQAEKELEKEVKSLQSSVKALKQAEMVSERRYRNGLIPLRNYLDTQQRRYQIEQNAILREQQKWNTRIALYLALGGDWFADDETKETCS